MWSDEINKKMEESGESNQPAFNEKAWDNMQVLLDKHLPEKKKRRRIIFFLLPLALAGGVFFFIKQPKPTAFPSQSSATTSSTDGKTKNTSSENLVAVPPGKDATEAGKIVDLVQPVEKARGTTVTNSDLQLPQVVNPKSSYSQKEKAVYSSQHNKQLNRLSNKKDIQSKGNNSENHVINEENSIPGNTGSTDEQASPSNSMVTDPAGDPIANKDQQDTTVQVAKTQTPQDTVAAATATVTKKQNSKSSFSNKFSLTLSLGPDVSGVGLDKLGKLQMQYGLGASYALSKKFSVRAGFFAGKKIYTADSSNYKTPYMIHNLEKIDANCTVYEIPVSLLYNFAAAKKHNWFIAGGLSSYVMKRETYGYHYKNAWGTPQYYDRTYKNENTHLFSVINLSGGYRYQFSDRFSLFAEPYVRIPLTGVGAGKVKLNSTGVLFTAGFKPFVKGN